MNKSYRALIVMMFILFEVLYVLSALANVGTLPAYIIDNSEMILFAMIVFNMILLTTILF